MAIASNASLLDALRQLRLLETPQLEELLSLQARYPEPKALARELIQRGWLTPFQANQLFQGKGADLLLGSYILLERVGEGGMGQVFKAKNWKLGRIVALKLLRKERLANPDDIRRFEREVRAAAALSHPNIVLAYDADLIGSTHLLVMEYVAGATDLSRLVKKQGPLPVVWACEYVRQAALGLQHAHEQGMVHRDIKPANLLLGADGKVVKVMDMGLVRQDKAATDDSVGPMTQLGVVMGTPDYMAPEQALESHTVDIRADLYSLGCTFYFLLAGRPPFPTGNFIQKIYKHQHEEAPALEALRPEVPPGVARVVRKLMAKRPEDRYQTPAEVAAVLVSVLSPGSGPAGEEERPVADGHQAIAGESILGDTLASPFTDLSPDTAESFHSVLRRPAAGRPWLLWSGVGGILGLAGLIAFLVLFFQGAGRQKPHHEQQPGAALIRPQPPLPDGWLRQVAALPAEQQLPEVIAKLKERNPDFDGQWTPTIEAGVVTELEILTDHVTDLSPLRALSGLLKLNCSGTSGKGPLADLAPLKGLKLTSLTCSSTQVEDLGPLREMKLTSLRCPYTKVSNLAPLKNMPLTTLICHDTQVTDLTPLKALPLRILWCDFKPERDAGLLRSLKTLIQINGKSAQEFWKEVDGPKP